MKKGILIWLCLLLLLIPRNVIAEEISESNREVVTLSKCVDGDTAKFTLASGEVFSTRFLAIDTPETVHPTKGEQPYGKEASNYTCNALTNAEKIELEYDPASDQKDHYGRLLAWVYVDDQLLQANLVREGLAEVAYLYADYKYTGLLQDEEAVAKANHLNIWSDEKKTVEKKTEKPKQVAAKKEKNFFEKLFDDTVGAFFQYLQDLIDDIVKSVEDML